MRPNITELLLASAVFACYQTAPAEGIRFRDATLESGVEFVHVSGATGRRWYPETMGSGLALFDADSDGDLDLFCVNSTYWQEDGGDKSGRCALFLNDGRGRFEDVSSDWSADIEVFGQGVAAADYDADGDIDVYVTCWGDNVLLRNEGGYFSDATADAGVAGGVWQGESGISWPEWSTSAAWLDADADGVLDLVVGNYVRWAPETDIHTSTDGYNKGYALPVFFDGLPNRFYRGLGDSTFEEMTAAAGLGDPDAKTMGIALEDFDGDGRIDIAVANDTTPQQLYFNQSAPGAPRFREGGLELGIAYYEGGKFPTSAGMGVDAAALANDERLMLLIGNFTEQVSSLFELTPKAAVAKNITGAWGLSGPTFALTTFPVVFADFNDDGWLDMAQGNGHVQPDIRRAQRNITYRQPLQLFENLSGERLQEVTRAAGDSIQDRLVCRGLATGDLDGDGDLDMVVGDNGRLARIYLNESPLSRHRLLLKLKGAGANTQALGARVLLRAAAPLDEGVSPLGVQRRLVRMGSSYLSQSDTRLHFGLGAAEKAEEIRVLWPSGKESVFNDIDADRLIVIDETAGILEAIPFARREPNAD